MTLGRNRTRITKVEGGYSPTISPSLLLKMGCEDENVSNGGLQFATSPSKIITCDL